MALCPCEASKTCLSATSWSGLQPVAIYKEGALTDGWTTETERLLCPFKQFGHYLRQHTDTKLGCRILSQMFGALFCRIA